MHRRKAVVLYSYLFGAVALSIVVAFVVYNATAPDVQPRRRIRTEIEKIYPMSDPVVGTERINNRKVLHVAVGASFNPTGETAAHDMADRVAEIVREHHDLTGYHNITVRVERRFTAGIVHARSARNFQFPTTVAQVRRP